MANSKLKNERDHKFNYLKREIDSFEEELDVPFTLKQIAIIMLMVEGLKFVNSNKHYMELQRIMSLVTEL